MRWACWAKKKGMCAGRQVTPLRKRGVARRAGLLPFCLLLHCDSGRGARERRACSSKMRLMVIFSTIVFPAFLMGFGIRFLFVVLLLLLLLLLQDWGEG